MCHKGVESIEKNLVFHGKKGFQAARYFPCLAVKNSCQHIHINSFSNIKDFILIYLKQKRLLDFVSVVLCSPPKGLCIYINKRDICLYFIEPKKQTFELYTSQFKF